MPFYEYQCEACGHRLEALRKISDAPLLECPKCGEARLKKLISRAAFRLKGTGWYETDFKHNDREKADKNGAQSPKNADGDSNSPASGEQSGQGGQGGKREQSEPSAADSSATKSANSAPSSSASVAPSRPSSAAPANKPSPQPGAD